jgi:hypothetical protein
MIKDAAELQEFWKTSIRITSFKGKPFAAEWALFGTDELTEYRTITRSQGEEKILEKIRTRNQYCPVNFSEKVK